MDIEDIGKGEYFKEKRILEHFVKFVCRKNINSQKEYKHLLLNARKKFKISPSKYHINSIYQVLLQLKEVEKNIGFEIYAMKKSVRSWSGVLVITIVLPPNKFSCPKDCYMCPDERKVNGAPADMPRSYLSTEPAVLRAIQNNFDTARQLWDRLEVLQKNGHPVDKLEIIALGGTWSSHREQDKYDFCRDIFYAANVYHKRLMPRLRLDIEKEKTYNESARVKVIGITVETRPDFINKYELRKMRRYGVTRVQLGIQHTNDDLLKIINRGHGLKESIKAIRMCKEMAALKVDGHFMPDLPGATPEMDKEMITEVLTSSELQCDYIKWYPCLDVAYTKIREWKEDGRWKPYAEEGGGEKLLDVMMVAKHLSNIHTRYNRIQRDFPHEGDNRAGFLSKNIKGNFREELHKEMRRQGVECKCIRCREVKNTPGDLSLAQIFVETYRASAGCELFISMESPDRKILYGFIRLRFNDSTDNPVFPELSGAALIRVLHVYGVVYPVYQNGSIIKMSQHHGFGKRLLRYAEKEAIGYGYRKMAIVSGVGVRNYYRARGYHLDSGLGEYMMKDISLWKYYFEAVTHKKNNIHMTIIMGYLMPIVLGFGYIYFTL